MVLDSLEFVHFTLGLKLGFARDIFYLSTIGNTPEFIWHLNRVSLKTRVSSENKKMAQLVELPNEILHAIMIVLVVSYDGARDLARVSATCKTLMKVARQSDVLRAVNFQRLTFVSDLTRHHHRNDLLCRCARAGNLVAESILGKALLMRDAWFWNMVFDNAQPALIVNRASNGVLRHHKLVRSYIRHASCEDIIKMNLPLLSYVNTFVGYDMARSCGMLYAITRMCSYEVLRLRVSSISCLPVNARNNESFRALNNLLAQLTPPPGITHRDVVLVVFDRLFPPTLV